MYVKQGGREGRRRRGRQRRERSPHCQSFEPWKGRMIIIMILIKRRGGERMGSREMREMYLDIGGVVVVVACAG